MRARIIAIALTVSTVTLASGLGAATSASAAASAATWTVTPGGAAAASSGPIRLTDTKTKRAGTCTSSDVAGKLKAGSGLPGHDIGSVTAATFNTCTGPAHTKFTVAASDLPWQISFATYDAKTGSSAAR
jgi:nucleoid-associated protein YgaU